VLLTNLAVYVLTQARKATQQDFGLTQSVGLKLTEIRTILVGMGQQLFRFVCVCCVLMCMCCVCFVLTFLQKKIIIIIRLDSFASDQDSWIFLTRRCWLLVFIFYFNFNFLFCCFLFFKNIRLLFFIVLLFNFKLILIPFFFFFGFFLFFVCFLFSQQRTQIFLNNIQIIFQEWDPSIMVMPVITNKNKETQKNIESLFNGSSIVGTCICY
jgi:hypothetical protein